jgi:acetate kinase
MAAEDVRIKEKEKIISADDSRVNILVVPTNEELVIAIDTARLVKEARVKVAQA